MLIGITLIMLSSTVVFANGSVEDMDNEYYGPNGNRDMRGNQNMGTRGMNGNQGMMGDWDDMETTTVEGTFSMVEDRYPSVNTNQGETFYLLIHFPISEDQIPAEGAFLKLETFQSPMAPDQLIVLSGEADGVVFDGMNSRGMMGRQEMYGPGDMDGSTGRNCGYGRHGGYGRQGMNGNRGMNGQQGMNGNQGNWGTPTPQGN